MNNRYKITISNKQFYKEIELSSRAHGLRVGTGVNCDVRLRKEMFFEPIELTFLKDQSGWSIICGDNLYLTVGDVRKLMTRKLAHGDTFKVEYQRSNQEVFTVSFYIDFDTGGKKYERRISIGGMTKLAIGDGPNHHIQLRSPYIHRDSIELIHQGNGAYRLQINHTTYGVYLNGRKVDTGALIKSMDFLSLSDFFFYFKDNYLWTQRRDQLTVNGLAVTDFPELNDYPMFVRSTRLKTVLEDESIEILDPPEKPQKQRNNLIVRLLPALGMIAASVIMASIGGRMIMFSAIMGGIAIITAVIGVIQNNRDYKRKVNERLTNYNDYIARKKEEIEAAREAERLALEDIYIDQEVERKLFAEFSGALFDRVPDDEDFLCIRLGSGSIPAHREVTHKKVERIEPDDELQMQPTQLSEIYKDVHNAPVICNLKEINALGIIGAEQERFSMLKNIVVDICARQYHKDVHLFFIATEKNKEKVYWLRHLPQVNNNKVGIRNIVCNNESKNLIFEYIYKELTFREQSGYEGEHLVLFFYDEYDFKTHPISKFVDNAKELNVTFVFFTNHAFDTPVGCNYLVQIKDSQHADLINCADKGEVVSFVFPDISNKSVRDIIQLMAPVYTSELSLEGSLTKNITLFELLHILAPDDLRLQERWSDSQVDKSMSAPIGVSKSGVVRLDLHDKADGPHGLVAGTTGSGKSEILQTYVLSMAALYHPHEVAFMIIDFKGGGMANQFADLPHLLGAITNIDGKAINRSLKSIKAELQKRQRLFAEQEVNHIDRYIKLYRAGEAKTALPHLIIIVDEFAELKAEQPDFMKELISAARIGRSLGVHLILATQKPSGQVNEQIWSNSRFKLCLKVQSQEDSNEVLKSPLAAEIKEPGRAYLQVGNNERFELFQSAYSGASEVIDDNNVKTFTISEWSDDGRKRPVFEQRKQQSDDSGRTQLEAMVDFINRTCVQAGIAQLSNICLPELPEHIPYPKESLNQGHLLQTSLGIYDDPDKQEQGAYEVELGVDNLMIIGSAQSGKTNLLQVIVRSLATRYSPNEVNLYIIDFASMVLKSFEKLNHIGGVVCSNEDEKLKNLFKLLFNEIERRRERMVEVGVSSFAAYKEAGFTDLPHIVLMVDNLTMLKELYFQDDDDLLEICREGLAVGITVIIANAQLAGVSYRYLANFSTRIALFCNDRNEYMSLFDHCREEIDDIPGRSIVEVENKHLECQTYLAFEGEREIDRAKHIKAFVESTNQKYQDIVAKPIPIVPELLTTAYIEAQSDHISYSPYEVVAGYDFDTVTPKMIDMAHMGVFGISGRTGYGQHNFISYLVDALERRYDGRLRISIIDDVNKRCGHLRQRQNVVKYSLLSEDAVSAVIKMEEMLNERYDELLAGNEDVLDTADLLLLIIDNADAVKAISDSLTSKEALENNVKRYKHHNAAIADKNIDNDLCPMVHPIF